MSSDIFKGLSASVFRFTNSTCFRQATFSSSQGWREVTQIHGQKSRHFFSSMNWFLNWLTGWGIRWGGSKGEKKQRGQGGCWATGRWTSTGVAQEARPGDPRELAFLKSPSWHQAHARHLWYPHRASGRDPCPDAYKTRQPRAGKPHSQEIRDAHRGGMRSTLGAPWGTPLLPPRAPPRAQPLRCRRAPPFCGKASRRLGLVIWLPRQRPNASLPKAPVSTHSTHHMPKNDGAPAFSFRSLSKVTWGKNVLRNKRQLQKLPLARAGTFVRLVASTF